MTDAKPLDISAKKLRDLPRRARRQLWRIARNGATGASRLERARNWRQSWRDVAGMRAPSERVWHPRQVPRSEQYRSKYLRAVVAP